ncbi:P-loop containing nucleoside triphosphate hydrolase protein [Kalaharituber pfeilii]|nr:P-loop containing nucleoside triphosphate hydrolase protein [Kalaharituber pfeilii]
MEEVLATLESTKAEVEANLTQVRRLKWTMLDKDKAIQLADELKAWNERLFALLPPRRLDPRGPKRNRHYIVPQRASPIFTGRATALSLLEEAFFGPEHDGDGETEDDEELERQRRAVLYGLGGAGKTQIALKFAEDYRDRFDSIFWVNCSSTVAIEEGFREITGILRLPVGTASNPVSAVKNRLAQLREKNWLLIFDNADDIQLAPYLPQGNHGNILITSRNPRVKQYLGLLDKQPYHVDEMSPQEAQELLLRAARLIDVEQMNQVVTVETQEHAQRIVKTLGYLALAIDQAGAYISNNGTIDTYLDVYESFRADLMEMREFEASGYAYAVYQTWEISFQAVKQKNKAAADLLEVFAYLHHERIPRSLFEAGSVDLGEDGAECYPIQLEDLKRLLALCTSVQATGTIAAAQWRPFHFDNAINQLVSYSLVKKNEPPIDKDLPPTFSIHPLVHSWMRDRKATEESRKTAAQNSTVALLRQAALAPTGQTAYALRSHLQTHIDSWVLSILEIDPLSSSLGPTQRAQIKTIGAFAVVYHEVGRLQLATRLRERVLTWCTKNLSPPSHPDIIKARTVLAETYRRSTVRIPQAQVLDAETVELLMSAPEFGPDHTSTITAKLNLAASLSEAGDRLGALLLEQEVIVSRTRALGPDHIDVAVARGNLGVSLLRLRRYPSAEVELRAAYKQRLAIVGEKHPGTLLSMGNLAGALRGQGRFEEAGELLRRVIEIRTGLLGEDHQDVARAKSNYGYTLFSAGRLEEAEKLEMEAAKALEAKLGPYHAFTMDAMSNLGQVYLKMMEEETQQGTGTELAVLELRNRWEKAQKTLVELVERKRFVLGDTHTSTKEAVKLLVQYYGRVGMNSEAYEFETQFGL